MITPMASIPSSSLTRAHRPGITSPLDFALLKRSVSIEQVLAAKGLLSSLRKQGSSLVGPCPIHRGDSPRAFSVSLTRNLWHCFTRCDAGGDVVDLARRLDGLSYRETALYLASLPGSSAPLSAPPRAPRPFAPFPHRLRLNPHAAFLQRKQILPQTATAFDSGLYRGDGFLSNCVGVRLHDPAGLPLGYAGRRLDPDEIQIYGKWKLPQGLPKHQILYNRHRINRADSRPIALVECPWSVMRLHQIGIPAVALLGTALSDHQHRLLLSLHPHRLILLLDADDAGRAASARLFASLQPILPVVPVHLPPDLDPDDLEDADLAAMLRPCSY